MLARTVRPALRSLINYSEPVSTRVRAYHEPAHFKPGTLNDLPVPQGSWQADYDAKQRKNNIHLLAGIAFAALSLTVTVSSGLVVLNSSIPGKK